MHEHEDLAYNDNCQQESRDRNRITKLLSEGVSDFFDFVDKVIPIGHFGAFVESFAVGGEVDGAAFLLLEREEAYFGGIGDLLHLVLILECLGIVGLIEDGTQKAGGKNDDEDDED